MSIFCYSSRTSIYGVRNGKVSDATIWATNLNSYTVKVDETNEDILVNPNGRKIYLLEGKVKRSDFRIHIAFLIPMISSLKGQGIFAIICCICCSSTYYSSGWWRVVNASKDLRSN
jgi:hypothetical protein